MRARHTSAVSFTSPGHTSVPKRHLRWSVVNAANPAPSTTTRPARERPPCGTSASRTSDCCTRTSPHVVLVFSVTCTSSSDDAGHSAADAAGCGAAHAGLTHRSRLVLTSVAFTAPQPKRQYTPPRSKPAPVTSSTLPPSRGPATGHTRLTKTRRRVVRVRRPRRGERAEVGVQRRQLELHRTRADRHRRTHAHELRRRPQRRRHHHRLALAPHRRHRQAAVAAVRQHLRDGIAAQQRRAAAGGLKLLEHASHAASAAAERPNRQ